MALFDIKTQTTVGRNYLTQAVAGSKIIWDNVKVSKDYFSNPVGLTDLTNIIISSPIDYAKQVSNEQFDIGGHVDSSKVHSDTIIKTWGLYGHVGTDNSQLLAVLSSQSGQTLYANTRDVQTIKETFSLVFPNPSNTPISFVVSNSGFALDDNVVHTTGDETASGVKNFQDGVRSGGKNVVTQNGDDTINVTNGLKNNVIELVDKSKIKDSIIQASLSSSNNIDNLENDGRYPFDSVTIAKIDPNNKISGYLDQSTNGSTIIQGTVYTVGTTKYVKHRSKSNGIWSDWNTSASVADMEVELANKVTDNKNGSIQVNGSSITPADNSKVVHTADTSNWQKQAMFNLGSYLIDATSSTTNFATLLRSKYNKPGVVYIREGYGPSYAPIIDTVVICEGGDWWYAYGVTSIGNFVHRQIAPTYDTGWIINADDSKVVHSTDMRKPASDVAGIEEVNTKQDKIGYTPADDSKVVHYDAIPNSLLRKYLTSGTDLNTIINPGIFPFNQCTFVNDINSTVKWGEIVNNVLPNQIIRQEMIQGNGVYGYRIYNGGNKQWSSWLIPADDSKVAHLSGANNFDTVPTVNNNPLLLASSLPSDLARTGSNQEFTGKNTFDIAPIDQTTGNPYITKDGVPAVPSTLADTTKLANFIDGLQSGGKDVATTDQLPVSSDTGWVDAQTNFSKQTTDWLKQRVKNGVLYIIGNMYVSGSESSLIGYMAVKINPSWKLPTTPIVESYYDNMSSEIISSTNAEDRTGKSFVTFNNSASVSEGYLLSFVSTSGNAHNLGINLAIPID